MRRFLIYPLLVVILTIPLEAQDAAVILQKVDSVMNAPRNKKVEFRMELIDKNKKSIRRGISYETYDEKRFLKFTAPASVRGIGFLSLPGDLMYIYLPSFRKVRRIATSVKNTNFAGTDFTYDELSTFHYSKKYVPELLKSTDSLWVLKLKPRKPGDYAYLIMYVDKRTYIPLKIEFYDKGGNLWKILEEKKVRKVKNYYIPTVISMEDLKKNHKTIMYIDKIEVDTHLPKNVFTKRYLRRG